MADGKQITAFDLALIPPQQQDPQQNMPFNLRQVKENAEKAAINKAISIADGNMSKAAELLGVTRPTLYSLMEKYMMQK